MLLTVYSVGCHHSKSPAVFCCSDNDLQSVGVILLAPSLAHLNGLTDLYLRCVLSSERQILASCRSSASLPLEGIIMMILVHVHVFYMWLCSCGV